MNQLGGFKQLDLRKHAREVQHACLIRIPNVCRWEPTVLCHLRHANVAGVGQKPPDLCAVIGCDACHSVIDGRVEFAGTRDELRVIMFHALLRTLALYETSGFVLCEEERRLI